MKVSSINYDKYIAAIPISEAGNIVSYISSLLASAEAMTFAIDQLSNQVAKFKIDVVAG